MNLIKTSIFLFITILIMPPLAFYFSEPLTVEQVDLLKSSGLIATVLAGLCFIVSELSRNYSQVDKLWSLAPIIYCWHIASKTGYTPITVFMSILVTIWGLRLSFNFWRRGGYTWPFWGGEEDYRWAVLRAKKGFDNPLVWRIFNLFFICGYQMGLIWLFTMPIVVASKHIGPIGVVELILGAVFILLVVIETIADQQQWTFQNRKNEQHKASDQPQGELADGFLQSGLWGIVRHPNYAAEQAIWIVFYFLGATATAVWLNWSVIGVLLLIVLFKSSSDFSEEISSSKYSKYAHYIANVPRFIPFIK